MKRLGIKNKILLAVLGLPVISLIFFVYIVYTNMKHLGDYCLNSSVSLGELAAEDSAEALEEQAREHLLLQVKDKAALSNAIFENVKREVTVMAEFASEVWSRPPGHRPDGRFPAGGKETDARAGSAYALAPGTSAAAVEEELALSKSMDSIFAPVFHGDSNLDSVYLGTQSGIFRTYPDDDTIDPSYDPRKRNWYQEAARTGQTGWTSLYVDATGHGLMVTCFKPFLDAEGRLAGVVGADVTLTTMDENIVHTRIGQQGFAFVIDGQGNVISEPGLEDNHTVLNDSFASTNLLAIDNPCLSSIATDMISSKTGVAKCAFEGRYAGDKYVAYAPITITGWSLGAVLPVEEIIAPAKISRGKILSATGDTEGYINGRVIRVGRIILALFALMITAVSLLALRLSRKITTPIMALDEGAKVIGDGNLDYLIHVRTGDEIEDLAKSFNKMSVDLKNYIENLKETTAAKEKIESELKVAQQIQTSMLPRTFPPFPDRKELSIYASMVPAREVGGDLYDFFFIDRNRLCFVVGDVSGKGVPAALFMVITKILIKNEALNGYSPDQILFRVNNILYPDNEECMFVTVFCAILDLETGQVQFANAGHNPPLLRRGINDFEFLDLTRNFVLGPRKDTKYVLEKISLNKDDFLFLYTDGVTEAMNPESKLFSEQRLRDGLSKLKHADVKGMIEGLKEDIDRFAGGAEQSDDITMLAVKFTGGE